MTATSYLVLLLVVVMAGGALCAGMQQKRQQPEPDPRRPRPPPPAPPRPPPPPPQPPHPPPAPPAGPQVPDTRNRVIAFIDLTTSETEQQYVMDVEPNTSQVGNPSTGAGNLASISGNRALPFGKRHGNLKDKMQNVGMFPHNATHQDAAATKRMKVNDERQQTSEAQEMNRAPPVQGSAVEESNHVTELLLKISAEKTCDVSKSTLSCNSEDPTKSNTADRQYCPLHQRKANEVDRKMDSDYYPRTVHDFYNDASRLYIDADWNLYRRLNNVKIIAIKRKGQKAEKLKLESKNARSSGTAPAATVQPPHSAILSSSAANEHKKTVLPLPPVECFTIQKSDHKYVKDNNKHFARLKIQYTPKASRSASQRPAGSACQMDLPQGAASLHNRIEQQLPGGLPQKQMGTPSPTLAAGPRGQVISSRLASHASGDTASALPPLSVEGHNRNVQPEATSGTEKQSMTQAGIHPEEKRRNTGSCATPTSTGAVKSPDAPAAGTAMRRTVPVVDGQGAGQQRQEPISVKPATKRDCAAISVTIQHTQKPCSSTFEDRQVSASQSRATTQGAATQPRGGEQQLRGNMQHQQWLPQAALSGHAVYSQQAGCRNEQLPQNRPIPHMESPIVAESFFVIPWYESYCRVTGIRDLGNSVNQQPLAGRNTASSGAPGTSRNPEGAAVQANVGPLPTRNYNRPPGAANTQAATQRAAQQRQQGGSAPGANSQQSRPPQGRPI